MDERLADRHRGDLLTAESLGKAECQARAGRWEPGSGLILTALWRRWAGSLGLSCFWVGGCGKRGTKCLLRREMGPSQGPSLLHALKDE